MPHLGPHLRPLGALSTVASACLASLAPVCIPAAALAAYTLEYQSLPDYLWAAAPADVSSDPSRFDLNGDGIPEIVLIHGPAAAAVFEAYDGRSHAPVWQYNTAGATHQLLGFFDIDNKNGKEAVFAASSLPSTWITCVEWPSGTALFTRDGSAIAILDIDADGRPELVMRSTASGSNRVEVWGDGDTAPTAAPAQPAPAALGSLRSNAPNPFHPGTRIDFEVDRPGAVSLRIFDAAGRLVRQLVSDRRDAGAYGERWDGTDDQGAVAAAGVYYAVLESGGVVASRKMVMLK